MTQAAFSSSTTEKRPLESTLGNTATTEKRISTISPPLTPLTVQLGFLTDSSKRYRAIDFARFHNKHFINLNTYGLW